jgi:ketopantoate reductase
MATGERIVIVGMGEIGKRLAAAGDSLGVTVTRVTRSQNSDAVPGPAGTPLLLSVRESDLPEVLAKIPRERGRDTIFVQNGFVDEAIAPYKDHTRAVLWFTAKGSFFADLLQSPVFGPRADIVRRLIRAAGASAEEIADRDVFRRYALEKAVWSCVVGAPLTVWGCDLTTARHQRMADIEAIVKEACSVVRAALGAEIEPARVLATLDDTSTQLGWMRGGTKAIGWRNGKVVEWGRKYGIATPANRAVVDATMPSVERVSEIE